MSAKAMILAAGRGERMRPLTDTVPKPLLDVAGKHLIEYRIEALVQAGIKHIVINVSYQSKEVMAAIGTGERYGANIEYSVEQERLETGGGIVKALPLLAERFIVVNSDIWTDFDFAALVERAQAMESVLAHLVLVDNPSYHLEGDLELHAGQVCKKMQGESLTYSGIALYHKALFSQAALENFRVTRLWTEPMQQGKDSGEHFCGLWQDIGTPERLEALRKALITRTVFA